MNRPNRWVNRKIGWLALGILLVMVGPVTAQQKAAADGAAAAKKTEASASKKKAPKAERKKLSPKTEDTQNAAPADTAASAERPAETQMDQGTYTVRLRDLEERVNRLKEQIFRSKARLSLLAESVLEKKIAGAQAFVSFRNEMGGSFRLYKATLLLDGGAIFTATDEAGSLSKRQKIDLFEGPVMPGDHTLEVVLQYKGHGYGIFSYLKGYTFKIRSSYTFTVNEGKAIQLEVIGFEQGGATTPLEDRPAVRYVEEFADYDIMNDAVPAEKTDE